MLDAVARQLELELGLLVRGGHLPGEVVEHFDTLVEAGLLVRG